MSIPIEVSHGTRRVDRITREYTPRELGKRSLLTGVDLGCDEFYTFDDCIKHGVSLEPKWQFNRHHYFPTHFEKLWWITPAERSKVCPDFLKGPKILPLVECQPQGGITNRGPSVVLNSECCAGPRQASRN